MSLPRYFARDLIRSKKNCRVLILLSLLHQMSLLIFLYGYILARDSVTSEPLAIETSATSTNFQPSEFRNLNNRIATVCDAYNDVQHRKVRFDNVVIVIIDALGADFIPTMTDLSNGGSRTMPFIESMLDSRQALGFIAHAATPTVTMPRIKALMSGTLPSYVDIIYNVFSRNSNLNNDNIINLAAAQDKRLIFYGDDTWLSLFEREIFVRCNETFSFFATDYTSVDTNVTENAIPDIYKHDEWDIMILHYLGLDHIGHTLGKTSPLIKVKLIEMDNVIRDIFQGMQKYTETKTLLVVCGDHGMTMHGNHGGDSAPETETAMIFLPINVQTRLDSVTKQQRVIKRIQQIDFAATMSILLGLPIPRHSKGKLVCTVLKALLKSRTSILCDLFSNALQMKSLLPAHEHDELNNLKLFKTFKMHLSVMLNGSNESIVDTVIESYETYLEALQSKLLKNSSNNFDPSLFFGTALSAVAFSTSLWYLLTRYDLKIHLLSRHPVLEVLIASSLLLAPILPLGSTNFIEFEGSFWPYLTIISLLSIVLASTLPDHTNRKKTVNIQLYFYFISALLLTWVSYLWKHPEHSIITNTLSNSNYVMGILFLISEVVVFYQISSSCASPMEYTKLTSCDCISAPIIVLQISIKAIIFCLIFLQKFVINDMPMNQKCAQLAFVMILADFVVASLMHNKRTNSSFLRTILNFWLCLVCLLNRQHLVTLLAFQVTIESTLARLSKELCMSPLMNLVLYYYMANKSFFDQGNSNSLSTIDITPAYIGQESYSPVRAALLVWCSTYSLFVYWIFMLFYRISESIIETKKIQSTAPKNVFGTICCVCNVIASTTFLSVTFYMIVAIILRNHLFIWSVISPKFLYVYSSCTMCLISLFLSTLISYHDIHKHFKTYDRLDDASSDLLSIKEK